MIIHKRLRYSCGIWNNSFAGHLIFRYLFIINEERLKISHPSVDSGRSEVHPPIVGSKSTSGVTNS